MSSKRAKTESSSHSKFLIHYTGSRPLSTERRKPQWRWRGSTKGCKRELLQVQAHGHTLSPGLHIPTEGGCKNSQEKESWRPKPTQIKQERPTDHGCSVSFAVFTLPRNSPLPTRYQLNSTLLRENFRNTPQKFWTCSCGLDFTVPRHLTYSRSFRLPPAERTCLQARDVKSKRWFLPMLCLTAKR